MARPRLPILLAALIPLAACTPDRVTLAYGMEEGRRDYVLTLRADVTRTLSGDVSRELVEAEFRAGQEITQRLPGGGARAIMSLVPASLTVNGEPAAVGRAQEFVVELGPDGRLLEIGEATEEGAEALEPVGIERLLPRLRPVLPEAAVALGETWSSESSFDEADGEFSLSLASRLDRLGVADGHRAALVRTRYRSPVDRTEVFANAVADISGRDVGTQEAWFSLDGFLIRAAGDASGRYGVTFRPPEDQPDLPPVQGALEVELHTEITLVG